jgi:hypothetical protein
MLAYFTAMVAVFGLGEHYQDDLVPLDRLVESHVAVSVHDLAREGLLVLGTEARIEGLGGHAPYHLAVRQAGILELDGQPIRVAWHRALAMRVFVCTCGRDCYKLHRSGGVWACRRCHGLDYACRHRGRTIPGLNRAIYLRRRLGVDPRPFAPIEPRPLSHRRFWRLVLELRELEARLVTHLRQDVRIVLEKRDGKRRTRSRGDPA